MKFKIIKSNKEYVILREIESLIAYYGDRLEDVSITFGDGTWVAVIKYKQ